MAVDRVVSSGTPATLLLELARGDNGGDPLAFRWGNREYLRIRGLQLVGDATLLWDDALADEILAWNHGRIESRAKLAGLLLDLLRAAGWAEDEGRIQGALAAGQSLCISLRFHAAELFALPWEALPSPSPSPSDRPEGSDSQALGLQAGVWMRYAWPQEGPLLQRALATRDDGRVLLASSNAGGAVPTVEHANALRGAFSTVPELHFEDAQDLIQNASLAQIVARLSEAKGSGTPFTALHLLCHGAERDGLFGLCLDVDDPASTEDLVRANALASALAPFADSLRLVVLSACNAGCNAPLGSKATGLALALHRAGFQAVIASRMPLSVPGSVILAQCLYGALLADTASLERAFDLAQSRLLAESGPRDAYALQLYVRHEDGLDTRPFTFRPYRGLLPFKAEHSRFFFGRDRIVAEILDKCRRLLASVEPGAGALLVITGPSGAGKSSLLGAGLLPAFRRAPGWEGMRSELVYPGPDPLKTVQEAHARLGDVGPRLLIVDHFEDLFVGEVEDALLHRAAGALALAVKSGLLVIAGIRGDFFDRLNEFVLPDGRRMDALVSADQRHVYLARPNREELRESIVRPAQLVGLSLQDGLAEAILDDIEDEPGGLPLVQHAMDQIWLHRAGTVLTLAVYQNVVGRLRGALSLYADQVFATLDPEQRAVAGSMLVELVRYNGDLRVASRRRRPISEVKELLGHPVALDAAIHALAQARLILLDGDPLTLEIAHEALIRGWAALGQRLAEGAEGRAARDWLIGLATEREREPSFVLVGAQLAAAENIIERFEGWIPRDIVDFVRKSAEVAAEAAAAEQRRREELLVALNQEQVARASADHQRRVANRRAGGLAVVAIIAIIMMIYAVNDRSKMVVRELAAVLAAHRERFDFGLIAVERAINEGKIHEATRLLSATPQLQPTRWMRDWLQLQQSPLLAMLTRPDISAWAQSGDGGTLALGYGSGHVEIYEMDDLAQVKLSAALPPDAGEVAAIWVDRSGTSWAALSARGALFAGAISAQPATGLQRDVYALAGPGLVAVAMGGETLSAASPTQVLWWRLPRGCLDGPDPACARPVGAWPLQGISMLSIDLGGSRLVMGGSGGEIYASDTTASSTPLRLGKLNGPPRTIGLDPAGARAVAVSGLGQVQVWNAEDGVLQRQVSATDAIGASLDEDGQLLVARAHDALLWGAGPDPERISFSGELLGLVFCPAGDGLIVTTADQIEHRSLDGHGQHWTLPRTPDPNVGALVAPDASALLSVRRQWDVALRLYRLHDDDTAWVLRGPPDPITQLRWSPDGATLATGSLQGQVNVWDLASQQIRSTWSMDGAVRWLAYSPDGSALAAATDRRTALFTGDGPWRWLDDDGSEARVRLRGQRLAWAGQRLAFIDDQDVVIWSGQGPVSEAPRITLDVAPTDIVLSSDGQRLAVALPSGELQDWSLNASSPVMRDPLLPAGHALSLLSNPERTLLIAGTDDGRVTVWPDWTRPVAPVSLDLGWGYAHDGAVRAAAVCTWGQRTVLATGGSDRQVRVWNMDGALLDTLSGHEGVITSLAFAPDNWALLTAGTDGVTSLWDLRARPGILSESERRAPAAEPAADRLDLLSARGDSVAEARYSPDFTRVATATQDGVVHLYSLNICAVAGLSDQEALADVAALCALWSDISPERRLSARAVTTPEARYRMEIGHADQLCAEIARGCAGF